MFLLHFLCLLSFSQSKYACFESLDDKKCDDLNEISPIKYIKYSPNDIDNLFNESMTSLNIAVFSKLNPINIPKNNVLNDLSILSDTEEVNLNIESQSLILKKLSIKNVTIRISTNQNNNIIILNITDSFERLNSHFLANNKNDRIRLVMSKCDSFNQLQGFDEFEIDSFQLKEEKKTFFSFPPITNEIFANISIEIISDMNYLTNDFRFILYSSRKDESLYINSKSLIFQNTQNTNILKINTSLPLTYIHNNSNILDVYFEKDYCDLISKNNEDLSLSIKFYSGKSRFHSECNSNIELDRSKYANFLINTIFYNDSSCEFDLNPQSLLPLSIISTNNLSIKLNQLNTTVLGYLFIGNGNITITTSDVNKLNSNYQFYCSSICNYSEIDLNINNKRLFSYFDLTESEFFESIKHLELTQFIFLEENIVFIPKFLLNTKNIVGGTTIVNLINEELSNIEFKPQTNLKLKENGTIVIPYHVNFNETYEGVMKIHHERYNELVENGENRTFDLDNFYDSFKYYYLKYLRVFDNFTRVFVKTYNQFYPPFMGNDQNSFNSNSILSIVQNHNNELNHFIRFFVKRDDSPIHAFYDTNFRPLICNLSILNKKDGLSENYEIEFSNSLVSELAKVSDFVLDGEVNFNASTSCIQYRVKKPPTSSSEFFAYLVNNDLIDTVKHIPFVSIITPMTVGNFFNLLRNKESRNIVIVVCEDMTSKLNLTQIRQDANVFIVGASVAHSSELIDFFNTIRKGNDLKNDLKKALDKISPRVPEIFPTIQVHLMKKQSLTAVGVTILKSLIECGSITFSLCAFKKSNFVCASNLNTDLYSIQNLLEITSNYRFLNVTLFPNFIGNNGGTTDLLSVTKIEFDENGWFFYSKGTIYDNVTVNSISSEKVRNKLSPSYNFGLPYILAEEEFSVYSITDNIEYSLIQSKIPPKSLHFYSGEKLSKNFMKNKISLLEANENIIEIPETTTLSFTGMWDQNQYSKSGFTFEFGDSNAVIQKVPNSLSISFSGNKNISIDCNGKNRKIRDLAGKGPISIDSINGHISIDSLTFKPYENSFLLLNRRDENLQISKVECEQHSRGQLNDLSLQKVVLNPDSKLEMTNLKFERKSTIQFNYNYDYEIPLLTINDSLSIDNLISVVMNYSRRHHSQYDPSFERHLNKSRKFLKIKNSRCGTLNSLFTFESDFDDFNDQKKIKLECSENDGFIEFSLKLISMPSLKLSSSEKVNNADQIKEEPLEPPYLFIPPPSPTPKENDMTAAIVGGSVGGVAFVGIVAFVVYFIISGRKEDEALLDSMEKKNGASEIMENLNEQSVESGIGVSIDESVENAASNEKKGETSEEVEKVADESKDTTFKDDFVEKP
ncbi:hypothetical protein M9Y10_012198 [Tritrichomonas musculus]|uniref:VWFA domain-containing protein n=1 Tax=Tritrichomonas musculus TaxID=1915356 RepID=A0ABR2ICY4_9EUKA